MKQNGCCRKTKHFLAVIGKNPFYFGGNTFTECVIYNNQQTQEYTELSKKSLDKMKLSILKYMKYLGGSEYSKCVVEGENVLNAGHLILAEKTEENLENFNIQILRINIRKVVVCKAGNSGKTSNRSSWYHQAIGNVSGQFRSMSQNICICSMQRASNYFAFVFTGYTFLQKACGMKSENLM
ncbi:hypothetical protein NQ317_016650 [Molorchus minor]|uniref:Uncharacterized protein n=1 Tax=Molorchus minor TaxID=1323400 RepID=A0ABQ9JRI0_9CUCU|nr:hypothetical protein NQ317_016650 [Molorchus minor]